MTESLKRRRIAHAHETAHRGKADANPLAANRMTDCIDDLHQQAGTVV